VRSAAGALRAALRTPIPADVAGLVEAMGGGPAFARRLARLPASGRLPARGTEARKRYQADLRQIQRYTTSSGQRRGQGEGAVSSRARTAALGRWRRVAAGPLRAAWFGRLRSKGAYWRVAGSIIVGGSKDPRREFRVIPPGSVQGYGLSGGQIGAVLVEAEAGLWDRAVAVFFEAAGSVYGVSLDPEGEEESRVIDWIRVWVVGDPEPGI
jgi:hypothetical protein